MLGGDTDTGPVQGSVAKAGEAGQAVGEAVSPPLRFWLLGVHSASPEPLGQELGPPGGAGLPDARLPEACQSQRPKLPGLWSAEAAKKLSKGHLKPRRLPTTSSLLA